MGDKAALRYAGLMGHEFVVIATLNGSSREVAASDDLAYARSLRAGYAKDDAVIYRRVGKTWKRTA